MDKLRLTPEINIIVFGIRCASVVDACWFESEKTGKATVFMPPEKMQQIYNLPIRNGLSGLEEAIGSKFLRRSSKPSHFIVNHSRILEVCRADSK
jgi:hypothetical protein